MGKKRGREREERNARHMKIKTHSPNKCEWWMSEWVSDQNMARVFSLPMPKYSEYLQWKYRWKIASKISSQPVSQPSNQPTNVYSMCWRMPLFILSLALMHTTPLLHFRLLSPFSSFFSCCLWLSVHVRVCMWINKLHLIHTRTHMHTCIHVIPL